MDEQLRHELREAGAQLREVHDDAIIADVIGEVERLDEPEAEMTAKVLRIMAEG